MRPTPPGQVLASAARLIWEGEISFSAVRRAGQASPSGRWCHQNQQKLHRNMQLQLHELQVKHTNKTSLSLNIESTWLRNTKCRVGMRRGVGFSCSASNHTSHVKGCNCEAAPGMAKLMSVPPWGADKHCAPSAAPAGGSAFSGVGSCLGSSMPNVSRIICTDADSTLSERASQHSLWFIAQHCNQNAV